MSERLDEFICPRCGHRWFADCAYGTCRRCQTFFYLSETPRRDVPMSPTVTWAPAPDDPQ